MNPNPSESSAEAIEERASEWFLERQEGLGPGRQQAFTAWLAADPRHAAALLEMEQTHALLEKLPFAVDRFETTRAEEQRIETPARRRWVPAFSAVAAAAAVAVVAWVQWPVSAPFTPQAVPASLVYATGEKGYERVTLVDGSVIELNSNSKVQVRITERERSLALVAGEAHFSVARDPSRPFEVVAGDYTVRALGTAFNIRLVSSSVEVLVTHGTVEVAEERGGSPARDELSLDPPRLTAGQRVMIAAGGPPRSGAIESVNASALREALAWQERRFVFTETPLREAVARFNQRNETQLIIGDPALGEKSVAGTFAADNVEAFVRLFESSGDIVPERRGDHEIILHLAR